MRRIAKFAAGTALATLVAGAVHAQENSVEVLHWWTSGGEAAALNVLKENLEEQGIAWNDMPVAGGAGTNAMTVLRARVTSGDAPTAVQMLGFDIKEWADLGVVANLNDLAGEEGWAEVVPDALQEFSKYDGQWIAAPVNVHSTNWLWINGEAFDAYGGEEPQNLEELYAMLDAFKEQGLVPLAHGGQPWQDATLWENVVLSVGGIDFYRDAVINLDEEALSSDTMREVFDNMTRLAGYFDENFSGRDWNLASAMVIEGDAGAQQMGDWAKGEFLRADMTPGEDFVCMRFPGTQGDVLFNSDQFVMFEVGEASRDAQLAMASAVMDPGFQVAFNTVKGSVPARTDIEDTEFDACGKKGMAELAEAAENDALAGSLAHGHAQPSSVQEAFFDVITQHLNGQLSTDEALDRLPQAIAAAQ
ncbi:ABC transporter substrate-binding protein [Chelativorans sp. M5D2P16]|uniref:ABC transporter substrate-binding protein n=1 Tax=Chelativorans sp. M5D2P16 TaxID=3095678 RepID=UPI002ACA66B0|nr:ABC transporter substrate-binding protein [Chelativorans sp. M5D2P16]MDZ5695998.1 ABC transporter substrate-binding protein [Chelativorans sp. M5D2P16]